MAEQLEFDFDAAPARQSLPEEQPKTLGSGIGLVTSGLIAKRLKQPRHRVKRILSSRRDITPEVLPGRTRYYAPETVARVRYELNLIDARLAVRKEAAHG